MNTEKLYLVSFGDSKKYILRDTSSGKDSKLATIESELNSFLKEKFPNASFTYYTSPHVSDIENAADYQGYPELDSAALESIKKVLTREVENMEEQSKLDLNAPYSNVNPAAADISNIL
ncbi:MAG: hypothetical protein HDS45_04665 [Bacteroides sp.]|nr:hypothetical protein [Bacteroides sp.]